MVENNCVMKKLFILSLCFFILAGANPVFSIGEDVVKMGYVCRDMEGNQRWQANTEIRKKEGDVYILTEKGDDVPVKQLECDIPKVKPTQRSRKKSANDTRKINKYRTPATGTRYHRYKTECVFLSAGLLF